ncbi:MAG: hypothetical protein GX547_02660 [Phycisphaerae bacterium]|nr:hypothetical protein [Phycisphaerae bacterium]
MRIRKRYWIPALTMLAICGGCYSLAIIPYRDHAQGDGWVRESSHAILGCWTCTGRMVRLTCNGQPVPAASHTPLH